MTTEPLDVCTARTEQRDLVFCAPAHVLAEIQRVRLIREAAVADEEPAERDLLLWREHTLDDRNK